MSNSTTKLVNPMKVITGKDTRWSYANVWEAKSINGGTPKFSVSLIIPKSDTVTVQKIKAAIQAAYEEGQAKLKGNGRSVPPLTAIKTPLRDGDTERPDDPAYYVEGSHPAIVDPDEWDHVQTEFARRKALGRAYSGKSVLSAKLVCEDCGGFFGSKVWHSTDRYRRTIWQCNGKFKGEERCLTPSVDTETVQRLFIQAYNRMMENREQIIKDCETMRRALTDFAELDAEIERQLEETQVVAELVKAAVKENASTAQSQEAYLKRYEALTERYEKAAAELERLQNLRTTQRQKDKEMALYIRTLKKQPVVLREWSDTIWTVMVEKAIVHRDGAITFVFKNGTEVKVGE